MLACFVGISRLPSLRGEHMASYLSFFMLAGLACTIAGLRMRRDSLPVAILWGFAILFRLLLLANTPSLSDDVYRYIWDGHLLSQGVNPYSEPVDSLELLSYDIPTRQMVNHAWMASPYLPVAQVYFAVITRIAPRSAVAFQVGALAMDLLTGWLVMATLAKLGLPRQAALLYLWNPLVVVEFAHGAHVDVLMLCLTMAALLIAVSGSNSPHHQWASALCLGAATLTKPLPVLLVPLLLSRWRWRGLAVYVLTITSACALFAAGAGWGLVGELDGRGVFGALRIYASYWNYNGSLYHWLEVWLSGYPSPGAVPPQVAGEATVRILRAITGGMTLLAALGAGLATQRNLDDRRLARLVWIPFGTYLLLAHTLHPWYVTLVLPFLPFLVAGAAEHSSHSRFVWPWLYFSIAVGLSYVTYLDPQNPREFDLVRQVEYFPLYFGLAWAAWPYVWRRVRIKLQ